MHKIWILAAALALLASACGSNQAKSDTEQYTERMAREHAEDAPTPGAAGDDMAPMEIQERAITQTEVVYGQVNGQDLKGVLSVPEGATDQTPAVIVIHEWWGLNENVKEMAGRLASQGGYTTLAVDMYGGQVAKSPSGARALMEQVFKAPQDGASNLKQAHGFLKARGAQRLASLGWCFGGGWSLQSAMIMGQELDAAVIYYGHVETDQGKLAAVQAPMLGIFGGADQGIPLEQVNTFAEAVKANGDDLTLKVYPGAAHAFANPSGKNYDAEAARDAWGMTLAFLQRHLAR
jgi:carboxymethylenebutenolidase